jgi:hypothetical protein
MVIVGVITTDDGCETLLNLDATTIQRCLQLNYPEMLEMQNHLRPRLGQWMNEFHCI